MTEPADRRDHPFRQPKGVWAVAFACVISFMGIDVRQAELLLTSYAYEPDP